MVTKSEAFPSKYLKSDNLPDGGKVFKIEALDLEKIGADKEEKYLLRFSKSDKALVLNVTNWDSIAAICGADSDEWPGKFVVLYPTETPFGNKMVPCIRVRRPREETKSKPTEQSTTTSRPATSQAPKAATSQSEAQDDIADEIPF
jgi:hypothetical protein